MKKKILYITSLVLILLAAASTWSYYCLNPSNDRVNKAKANIKVYSHYELIQNGKTLLMENEQHPDTFQPTENRYSGLGGEEFQPEKPDLTGKCLPLLSDKFAG